MPRATCRCGQSLDVPATGEGRVVCPSCGAKVRVRKAATSGSGSDQGDGYIRFSCPCGRRLKVSAGNPPSHGKCPDCDRVVPVPATSTVAGDPEAPTGELSPEDRAELERWAAEHQARAAGAKVPQRPAVVSSTDRAEVGLRVCPRCRKPIHLGAVACRECGTPVPKR